MSNDIVINMKKKSKVVNTLFKGTEFELPKLKFSNNTLLSIHNQTRPLTGNLNKDYSVTAYIKKNNFQDDITTKQKRKKTNKRKL